MLDVFVVAFVSLECVSFFSHPAPLFSSLVPSLFRLVFFPRKGTSDDLCLQL